jgi:hypothetical protein
MMSRCSWKRILNPLKSSTNPPDEAKKQACHEIFIRAAQKNSFSANCMIRGSNALCTRPNVEALMLVLSVE